MSSLEKAKNEVLKENSNLSMKLRFEVSNKETIDRLLKVDDLTLDTLQGKVQNIVNIIFNGIVSNLKKKDFQNIKIIRASPIVEAINNFDNLLFSPGNPGRSSTYTRYTDENHVLRTHTSALIPTTYKNLDKNIDRSTFVLPGLVYRRDVIDPRHLDVFHQIDVWTLQNTSKYGKANREDLLNLARAVFEVACPDSKMIVLEAVHPYTIEGIEVYAEVDGRQIEVLEAGLVHPQVLINSGIDPEFYSGLALGMGVERLIMARKNLTDIRLIRSSDPRVQKQMSNLEQFKPVSDQPAMVRDLSYCVSNEDSEEDICESLRNAFSENSELLEQVEIFSLYNFYEINDIAKVKLGAKEGQDNILVRITLRHPDRTLTKKEAEMLYASAYPKIHQGTTIGYA